MAVITESFFQAYLDESGTHAGAPIIVVAGYFGTQSQWDTYLEHWPHREFHACEPRFDCLKPQLATALECAELQGVEVCMRPLEFKSIATAELKSTLGNAYAICAFLCAARICDVARQANPMARVSIVLEDGQPNVRWVQRLLIMLMRDIPIASVTVAKKTEFPPLHAADLLSHSRSTTDIPWMDRLFAHKRVWEQPIEGDLLATTSHSVAELWKRYRNRKAKERRERRSRRTK